MNAIQLFQRSSASRIGILLLTILSVFGVTNSCHADSSEEQIRAAVDRSIPYLEERGQWWIEKKDCVSCHRVGNMIWTLSEAREKGFNVSHKLDEWTDWAVSKSLSENDKGKIVGAGNLEGLAQILLADVAKQHEADSDSRTKLVGLIRSGQTENGSWKPGGQLPSQKRPKPETAEVSTMWLTLALTKDLSEDHETIKKAFASLSESGEGKNTEWLVVRSLLAAQLNQDAEQLVAELKRRQQTDGGWPWLVGDQSDALATGMAIFALLRSGMSADDDAIQRSQQFLLESQLENGTWKVNGTKANKKDRVQETATYWGTAWATLALVEGLPPTK